MSEQDVKYHHILCIKNKLCCKMYKVVKHTRHLSSDSYSSFMVGRHPFYVCGLLQIDPQNFITHIKTVIFLYQAFYVSKYTNTFSNTINNKNSIKFVFMSIWFQLKYSVHVSKKWPWTLYSSFKITLAHSSFHLNNKFENNLESFVCWMVIEQLEI